MGSLSLAGRGTSRPTRVTTTFGYDDDDDDGMDGWITRRMRRVHGCGFDDAMVPARRDDGRRSRWMDGWTGGTNLKPGKGGPVGRAVGRAVEAVYVFDYRLIGLWIVIE